MIKFILALSLIFPLIIHCQTVVNGDTIQNMEVTTDQEAHYPDGDMAMYQYVYQNIVWPDYHEKVFNQSLSLSFDVLPDSSLTNFVVLGSVDQKIDEAVINVMKTLKFAPYIQLGTKTKSNQMVNIPIRKRFE